MHHILQYTAPLDTIIKAALRATMYLMRDPAPHPPVRSDIILFNSPVPSPGYWKALEGCWLVVTDREREEW